LLILHRAPGEWALVGEHEISAVLHAEQIQVVGTAVHRDVHDHPRRSRTGLGEQNPFEGLDA
jgi:hypothetical protein